MENQRNKDIIQTYILTLAKYDANIYVKRILTHIVSASQDYVEGQKVSSTVVDIEEDLFRNRQYTLDAKEILFGEKDKNYKRVYDAFDYMQSKFFLYEDDDIRFRVPFITAVYSKKSNGLIRFHISELVYKAFTDYTKGFRKYELNVSLSLTSVYSMRLYEVFSGQKTPIIYTIEKLKGMFNIQDKYKKHTDLIKRVIEPAKKELDEKSPVSFEYSVIKRGAKFHAIKFYPIDISQNRDENLESNDLRQKVNLSWDFDKIERQYLSSLGFTERQIKNNFQLLMQAKHNLDFVYDLSSLIVKVEGKTNPQGFVIEALRGKLKDRGIIVERVKKKAH